MILHTDTLGDLEGINAATLTESTKDVGTLALSFAGFGPSWLDYMTPVTLMHKGRVLFHGKITSLNRSTARGDNSTEVVVSNFLWLFDHLTLSQQIAQARASQEESESESDVLTWSGSAVSTGQIAESWEEMSASVSLVADDWMVQGDGSVVEGGTLTLSHSALLSGRACWAVTSGLITTWSALLRLREKAPDVQFIVDYEAGTVTATAIGDMPLQTWDAAVMEVYDAAGISPQWEACVTGVCVLQTFEAREPETESGGAQNFRPGQSATPSGGAPARTSVAYLYPPGLDLAQTGVKVFTVSENVRGDVAAIARQYYDAASVLQWGGSVRARMEDVPESPLGGRLNLTGPGMHESWASMNAVVTGCTWDFVTREVTVDLGRDFSDPEFADKEEDESGGGDTDPDEEGSGGEFSWPSDSDEGSYPVGSGSLPLPNSDEGSDPGSEEGSDPGSEEGSDPDGSQPSSGSSPGGSQPTPGSTPGGGSRPAPGSRPGSSGSGTGSGSEEGSTPGSSGSQPGPGSTPGSNGSQPGPGSTPGSSGSQPGPGSTPGSSGSQPGPGGCGCSANCSCPHYDFDPEWFEVVDNTVTLRLAKIDELVAEAAAGLTVEVQVEGLVESTAFGTIHAATAAQGNPASIIAAQTSVSNQ